MAYPTPSELLKDSLNKIENALKDSKDLFDEGKISQELHEIHVMNNEPIIDKYKIAIGLVEALNL